MVVTEPTMNTRRRIKVRNDVMDELYRIQDNHCVLCETTHPLECHHIRPVSEGGDNSTDNLVLLCRNHHDLADSGILPSELLRYYKCRLPKTEVIVNDTSVLLYELCANNISRDLQIRYDEKLLRTAFNLVSRMKRARNKRYKRICLELIKAILFTSMHSVDVDRRIFRLFNFAKKLLEGMGKDDVAIHLSPILHYGGVIYHQQGEYAKAISLYNEALSIESRPANQIDSDYIEADRLMTEVHVSSSRFLSGEENKAFEMAMALFEKSVFGKKTEFDANFLAHDKLAQHYIQQKKYIKAYDILNAIHRNREIKQSLSPIHRVILLRDLAIICLSSEEKDLGHSFLLKAISVAAEYNYKDQMSKIVEIAKSFKIRRSDLILP